MNHQPQDPRPSLGRAMATATDTMARLTTNTAGLPTPCRGWTTGDVACHLMAVADRIGAIGEGRDPGELPLMRADLPPGEWSSSWAEASDAALQVWSDDSLLGQEVTVPWGRVPGGVAIGIYCSEILVHTWDLAEGLDLTPTWNEADVRDALDITRLGIPASPRGDGIPFESPTEAPAGSIPIVELAAWTGRRIRPEEA